MLKRSDLAKEFELVVRQEITNYHKSLNQILRALDELKNQIKVVEEQSLENFALVASQQKSLEIDLQLLKKEYKENSRVVQSHINDQAVINMTNGHIITGINSEIAKKDAVISNIRNRLEGLENNALMAIAKANCKTDALDQKIDQSISLLRKESIKMKDEILSHPSDAAIIKKQLEEQLATHKLDVDGVLKELRIYKKEAYFTEKNIESIYTQIARLKGDRP